jgi:phosphoserine phosphatase
LDVVCGLAGKEKNSARINKEFHQGLRTGVDALIERINFLKGVSLNQIRNKLIEDDFLMPGTKKLFNFLTKNNIISILHSGNIIPILRYYQKKLGINYLVGTKPKMIGNKIDSIVKEDFSAGNDFKLIGVKKALARLSILPEETIAIGDSPADKIIFDYAAKSIAINPKGNIEKFADYVIRGDLAKAIPIIKKLIRS